MRLRHPAIPITLVVILVVWARSAIAQQGSAVLISSESGPLSGQIEPLDEFGRAVAGLGDIDDDGFPDLLVGAPRTHRVGFDRGAVYLLYLDTDWSVRRAVKLDEDPLIGDLIEDGFLFGNALLALGDLDDDGSTEVAVGLPGADLRRGAVWLLSIAPEGKVTSVVPIDSSTSASLNLTDNARFGSSLAKLDDLNGDGVPEIAVGAPSAHKGEVWILSPTVTSTGISIDTTQIQYSDPFFSDRVLSSGPLRFGSAVTQTGDLDGDGIPDIAIGSPGDDFDGTTGGTVLVAGVAGQGALGPQRVLFAGRGQGDQLGSSLALYDDVDRNSVRELLVGSPRSRSRAANQGEVYRLFLGLGGQVLTVDSLSSSIDIGLGAGSLFGSSLDVIADLDGNGLSEILVGAPGADSRRGGVWIVFTERPSTPSISEIIVQPRAVPTNDDVITISANVTDETGVRRVWLDLRSGGETSWLTVQMTAKPGPTYVQEIPREFVTERGIEFVVRARSQTGLDSRNPESGFLSIPLFLTEGPSLVARRGTTVSSYQLISVPLDLATRSARANLTGDLGQPAPEAWRFFSYSAGVLIDLAQRDFDIEPGRAYWIIGGDSDRIIEWDAGTTVPSDRAFGVELEPGWNLFGSPFAFELPRDALRFSTQPVDIRVFESGSWSDEVEVIRPYTGYAVWNDLSHADLLLVDPTIRSETIDSSEESVSGGLFKVRNDLLIELVPGDYRSLTETIPGVLGSITDVYPNPTRGGVTLTYSVREISDISISAYDILGREIATILDREAHPSGQFKMAWNAKSAMSEVAATGMYLIRLSTGGRSSSGRMVTVIR